MFSRNSVNRKKITAFLASRRGWGVQRGGSGGVLGHFLSGPGFVKEE